LATELLRDATSDMTIGVVSAPSVFVALKNILVSKIAHVTRNILELGKSLKAHNHVIIL
jgi:hypothetical protein